MENNITVLPTHRISLEWAKIIPECNPYIINFEGEPSKEDLSKIHEKLTVKMRSLTGEFGWVFNASTSSTSGYNTYTRSFQLSSNIHSRRDSIQQFIVLVISPIEV